MFAHEIHNAVRDAMVPYIEKISRLIERSENRVDAVNGMMSRIMECEHEHAASMENASQMFRLAVERYSAEIEKMREFRDEQSRVIQRMQCEIDRLNDANAEIIRTHQLLVSQMTRTNINVNK